MARSKKAAPITWVTAKIPSPFRKLHEPLGAVVVGFNELENILTHVTGELLHVSYTEAVALETLIQSPQTRIQLYLFLAKSMIRSQKEKKPTHASKYDGLEKAAGDIFSLLQQANTDRNNLLHGAWSGIGVGRVRTFSKDRYTARDGKLNNILVEGISVALLRAEIKYLASIRVRLLDWYARAVFCETPNSWPAPLPSKYQLPSPLGRHLEENKRAAALRRPQSFPR